MVGHLSRPVTLPAAQEGEGFFQEGRLLFPLTVLTALSLSSGSGTLYRPRRLSPQVVVRILRTAMETRSARRDWVYRNGKHLTLPTILADAPQAGAGPHPSGLG